MSKDKKACRIGRLFCVWWFAPAQPTFGSTQNDTRYFRTLSVGEGRHLNFRDHGTLRTSGRELPGIRLFPISSFDGTIVMVIISLKLLPAGGWCVCRSRITLFRNMQLGPAITLARELARDEYRRSGRRIRVEMPGPDLPIVLARYAEDGAPSGADALAA